MIYIKDKEFLKQFGLHLYELRKKKGFSQEFLANQADISISQVSRIERGFLNPTLSTLVCLANALEMELGFADNKRKLIK